MITDPEWRQTDFRQRLHYYGTMPRKPITDHRARKVLVARNIARHPETKNGAFGYPVPGCQPGDRALSRTPEAPPSSPAGGIP
jgi:hypothetical protein